MSTERYKDILVVAATVRELAPAEGWRTLVCGVGPVEAAAATAAAIATGRPRAILHVGIAGARRQSAVGLLTVAVGTASIYCDLGVPERLAPGRLMPDAALVAAARRAVPAATTCPIGTSGRVGRTTGCDVEAMEGFAVLRAAALAGVPAVEVRVVANEIEEHDRTRWRFAEAFTVLHGITPTLVREVSRCLS